MSGISIAAGAVVPRLQSSFFPHPRLLATAVPLAISFPAPTWRELLPLAQFRTSSESHFLPRARFHSPWSHKSEEPAPSKVPAPTAPISVPNPPPIFMPKDTGRPQSPGPPLSTGASDDATAFSPAPAPLHSPSPAPHLPRPSWWRKTRRVMITSGFSLAVVSTLGMAFEFYRQELAVWQHTLDKLVTELPSSLDAWVLRFGPLVPIAFVLWRIYWKIREEYKEYKELRDADTEQPPAVRAPPAPHHRSLVARTLRFLHRHDYADLVAARPSPPAPLGDAAAAPTVDPPAPEPKATPPTPAPRPAAPAPGETTTTPDFWE